MSICLAVCMYHCSFHLISTKIYTGDFYYENVLKFLMFLKLGGGRGNIGHIAGKPKYILLLPQRYVIRALNVLVL
jgi:hypothetical protein